MIKESELIINKDGSVFHLHLKPGEIGEKIILVGDPGRVEMVASNFESIELTARNREFFTITGLYKGKRVSVISTGIGTDNIDIVLNELDALANIDFNIREIKSDKISLDLMRIGTSGSLQEDIPVNSFVISEKSIGFDGLLNFYKNRDSVCDLEFEADFKNQLNWAETLASPYVVNASTKLLNLFISKEFIKGVNISAPGFYGPQGRIIRLPLAMENINDKIEKYSFKSFKVTNYEMESSAIYGLSGLLGHHAITVCAIIANRVTGDANDAYHPVMEKLVKLALERFIN
ncbi:MAG: nucleoside phosphorylase [Prolixibacteraceae bacterium]|nr:nucleoside phosphorylase [Prolixibacteraceae bacterium]